MRMQNSTKQKLIKIAMPICFILGVAFILFPIVSQWVYYQASQVMIDEFEEKVETIDRTEIDRRIELAHAYNETVDLDDLQDPFTDLQKEGRAEYARMLEVNEQIGHVIIPTIGEQVPVYAGTSENVLQKGAGHLEGTSLPVGGASTHSVITAHRGLPTARLFTDLDKMALGDIFYMRNIEGVLAYQVDLIEVIEPDEFDAIRVESGEDYLTLLTCTPYMINSHRLIVRGVRVPIPEEEEQVSRAQLPWDIALPLILLLIILILFARHRWQKHQQKKARREADE